MQIKHEKDGKFVFIPQNDYEKGFLTHLADNNGKSYTLTVNYDNEMCQISFDPID